MLKEIVLTRGKVALVDDEDYEMLTKYKWRYMNKYAYTGLEGIAMHRMILNTPKGLTVDHINGDGLDNRRCNLRTATYQENCRNRGRRTDSSSKYKGVCKRKSRFKVTWSATVNNKYMGCFTTPEAAANCYNYHAKKIHGEFAKVNSVEFMDYDTWNSYKTKRGDKACGNISI